MSTAGWTKMTPEVVETICDHLRTGAYLPQAALVAGISRTTLWEWRKGGTEARGKENPTKREKQLIDFVDKVEAAIAECEISDLQRMDQFAERSETACKWRLERRFPERWGPDNKTIAELSKQIAEMSKLLAKAGITDVEQGSATPPANGPAQGEGAGNDPPKPDVPIEPDDEPGTSVDTEPGPAD